MTVAPAGAIPDDPSAPRSERLLASAAVQTLCRVALDGFDAVQHRDVSWLRGPTLRSLGTSAALRRPLAHFIGALQGALDAMPPCGSEPGVTAPGVPADPPRAPAPASTLVPPDASTPAPLPMPGDCLRQLALMCRSAGRAGAAGGGALPGAVAALDAAYGALSDAFGLTHDGPPPRPRLSVFVAALAFDVDALSTSTGPTPEQQEFASFRELMLLYEWI